MDSPETSKFCRLDSVNFIKFTVVDGNEHFSLKFELTRHTAAVLVKLAHSNNQKYLDCRFFLIPQQ